MRSHPRLAKRAAATAAAVTAGLTIYLLWPGSPAQPATHGSETGLDRPFQSDYLSP